LVGVLIGVGLTAWQVLPAKDAAARATCSNCHELHAAIEWTDAPFQSQIWVLGDVADATYFMVSDLFPYHLQTEDSRLSLNDLLSKCGVTGFEQVALQSLDGGLVILDRQYVTEESLLLPYLEGVRFRDQNQHQSTWLKGVRWVIVTGADRPLTIDGEPTSLGRMMLRETTMVTEGGSTAMFSSPLDAKIYRAVYTHTYPGGALRGWLANPNFETLRVTNAQGQVREFDAATATRAALILQDGQILFASPDLSRRDWVKEVVAIESE
jgi:hypothetical protein